MIPNITRGARVGGLLRYLYGPGKREEHTNPHLVAAWDGAGPLSTLEPPVGLTPENVIIRPSPSAVALAYHRPSTILCDCANCLVRGSKMEARLSPK